VNDLEGDDHAVMPVLPSKFGGNEYPPEILNGATILFVGTFKNTAIVEGGGLVIDCIPLGETKPERVTLAFNDTAMWVWDGE